MTGTARDGGAAAPDLIKAAESIYKEWSDNHKRANILIAGRTGVGKSTLINTVFRDDLAETGIGRPVTQRITELRKAGMPLTILDSKGLELADHAAIRSELLDEVSSRRGEDPDCYIHLAWLCINEDSRRIEEAELDLARDLKKLGLAVIVVVTRVTNFAGNEFEPIVRRNSRASAMMSSWCAPWATPSSTTMAR